MGISERHADKQAASLYIAYADHRDDVTAVFSPQHGRVSARSALHFSVTQLLYWLHALLSAVPQCPAKADSLHLCSGGGK